MTPADALQLFGEALFLVVTIVALLIVPSLLVGLFVSVLQAATQINEQTLSFLPRLLTTLITIMIAGPWLLSRLMEFTNSLYGQIPGLLG